MKTNLSTFREEAEEMLRQAEQYKDRDLRAGFDEDAAERTGEIRILEWLLDQDPIVLSEEDRERLESIADRLERSSGFLAQILTRDLDAAFLRDLAAGQREGSQ